jgi:thymidine phosphorylase
VGLTDLLPIGARVAAGEPLAVVHARTQVQVEIATKRVRMAYGIADRGAPGALLLGRITA